MDVHGWLRAGSVRAADHTGSGLAVIALATAMLFDVCLRWSVRCMAAAKQPRGGSIRAGPATGAGAAPIQSAKPGRRPYCVSTLDPSAGAPQGHVRQAGVPV
jgi:hypothetical protein